jgi:hypothetical protein
MKIKSFILLSTLFLFLISCQSNLEPVGLSDGEIVLMIQESDKLEIPLDQIPQSSINTIHSEYDTYIDISTKKAIGVGYQVELAGLGHFSGYKNDVYFSEDGRELNPNDWGRKRRGFIRDIDRKNNNWGCFEMIYPVSFDMPDGSVLSILSDDEEGWSSIKIWYESNPVSEIKPEIRFPLVLFFEEESITVNDKDELKDVYLECRYDKMKERNEIHRQKCFDLVYPIFFIMPDGSSLVINNDENGWGDLKTWYQDNVGFNEEKPEFQYPVDVVIQDDQILIINSEAEMIELKNECRNDWEY